MSAWVLLPVYVFVDVPEYVIVLFHSSVWEFIYCVSAWMLLHDVLVHVLDLRYRVASEWCFRIHII